MQVLANSSLADHESKGNIDIWNGKCYPVEVERTLLGESQQAFEAVWSGAVFNSWAGSLGMIENQESYISVWTNQQAATDTIKKRKI